MASLVADYSDSSDEENNTEEINDKVVTSSIVKEEPPESTGTSTNFFSADVDSEDDDDGKEERLQIKTEPSDTKPSKLPSLNEAKASRIGTSVFVNPFEEAEQAKNSILEKHVRLTEAAPKKPAHQPVCFKFKKGKCHLGKNCRFFHDRENAAVPGDETSNTSQSDHNPHRPMYHAAAIRHSQHAVFEPEPADDDNYMAGMKRKKRYGLNDHLMPPKKAFDALMKERQAERPWTMGFKQ